MKLPLSVAEKLLVLRSGVPVPASQLKHVLIDRMVEDGILLKQRMGSSRYSYIIGGQGQLSAYVFNHFGIADLDAYVSGYADADLTRAGAIGISSDSKLKPIRSFKGFLVSSYVPVSCLLNGMPLLIDPLPGTFLFIHEYEHFIPDQDVVIVGVENAENFRLISQQRYLFGSAKTLFISRYPQSQSGDAIRWLNGLPNQYLHFGDFDFEGIHIYLREYKRHLGERARFFVPDGLDAIIARVGTAAFMMRNSRISLIQ